MIFQLKIRYKRSIIISFFSICFKIPLSQSTYELNKREGKNSLFAARSQIWKDNMITFKLKYGLGYSNYIAPVRDVQNDIIRNWLFEKLEDIDETDKIINILDVDKIKLLSLVSIKNQDINKIIMLFTGLSIPLSSEHGDFHYKNIIMLESDFKVLDFASYKEKGSLLFDWLNYEAFLYTKNSKKGYEQLLTDGEYVEPIKTKLNQMSLPYHHMLFFYVIRRTLNELDEWVINGVGSVPNKIKGRYSQVIKRSLNFMNNL